MVSADCRPGIWTDCSRTAKCDSKVDKSGGRRQKSISAFQTAKRDIHIDKEAASSRGSLFQRKEIESLEKKIYGNDEEKVKQAVKHFKENFHIAKDQPEKPQMIKQVLS